MTQNTPDPIVRRFRCIDFPPHESWPLRKYSFRRFDMSKGPDQHVWATDGVNAQDGIDMSDVVIYGSWVNSPFER